jgi:hypothetical protein
MIHRLDVLVQGGQLAAVPGAVKPGDGSDHLVQEIDHRADVV